MDRQGHDRHSGFKREPPDARLWLAQAARPRAPALAVHTDAAAAPENGGRRYERLLVVMTAADGEDASNPEDVVQDRVSVEL